uniref:CAP-Gly domain-containing protein n=1 Tax=Phaeomonas parva TaxID=124430 RepID=A0A7S1TNN8_9STRA|mmetsp:Transcript_10837/g.32927  ORF Transcript_10837/g.32927 Transcript_10837/m.32927 type:complete len:273 (+) Transcript_10837:95-913(+)|eukprot:CAMPEP_0118857268 /NCGR_PEP_ID=MMETSP1163-20130328/4437_1 /TAXON_ID=124430 /ORGANISM="Phaeomonas parva, Strain CCMP2877" /LENGTH=272 /DNA_ID=CAMNT_0006790551 /DNA_START=99 /DNA_END=917 /DNA_ORIENTATION=+
MAADLAALRGYVTARDEVAYDLIPEHLVSLNISHSNLTQQHIEIKFERRATIGDVKQKIRQHCGTPAQHQVLTLRSGGSNLARLDDDSRMLGYYSPEHGMEIFVLDTDPHSLSTNGGLEDVSLVEKYRMTDDDYDRREGTLRDWVRKKKAEDPNWRPDWEGEKKERTIDPIDLSDECLQGLSVGERCEADPGGRRGVLMFLGQVDGLADGYWAGVKFDEPVGKADGTVKGVRVFDCEPRFGGFIRPRNVKTGDYPERDLLDDSDLDDDEDEL